MLLVALTLGPISTSLTDRASARIPQELRPEVEASVTRIESQVARAMIEPTNAQALAHGASEDAQATSSLLEELHTEIGILRQTNLDYVRAIATLDNSPTARRILNRLNRPTISNWPEGGYCVLANGECPTTFTRHEGYIKAIMISDTTSTYLTEANLGDSYLRSLGGDSSGHFLGQLRLAVCCQDAEPAILWCTYPAISPESEAQDPTVHHLQITATPQAQSRSPYR